MGTRLHIRCAISCSWLALGLLGCEVSESQPLLQVDVKTDYVPGEDFDSIRVEVGRGDLRTNLEHIVDLGGDYVRGRRIGSAQVADGDVDVVAHMIQDGNVVASREVIVTVRGDVTAATIVITRNCGNVECPAVGGDAALRSCYGGRCADPRCTVETPELCPSLCSSDAECSSTGCRAGQCLEGVCFSVPNDADCASGERCRGDGVCVVVSGSDGGPRLDAGAPDGRVCADDDVCNGIDDDCDGVVDEGVAEVCNGIDDDCDGAVDEDTFTGAEVCNGIDDDCDGVVDEGLLGGEVCNGIDDDCDGVVDESDVCGGCSAWMYNGSTYLLCPVMVEWALAMAQCELRGLDSVSIGTSMENAQLTARIDEPAWLGLNDLENEGDFVWENGVGSDYRNWDVAEPDDARGEDCVMIGADGRWNDVSCSATAMVLCQSR